MICFAVVSRQSATSGSLTPKTTIKRKQKVKVTLLLSLRRKPAKRFDEVNLTAPVKSTSTPHSMTQSLNHFSLLTPHSITHQLNQEILERKKLDLGDFCVKKKLQCSVKKDFLFEAQPNFNLGKQSSFRASLNLLAECKLF